MTVVAFAITKITDEQTNVQTNNKPRISFCGKELPSEKAENCDMVSDTDAGSEAGGRWAISVYSLGLDDADTNGITNESEGDNGDLYAVSYTHLTLPTTPYV